jgi:5-methylthioadenosine/S-adenosylhomocysteine deaminase
MALVIKGRVVPMAADTTVSPNPLDHFTGRVWIGDDGAIAAVTRGRKAGPAGFETAPVVDVGSSLVFPGLIDLHTHLAYNTLPLWTEPSRNTPWPHHDSWPRAKSYASSLTWPAYALITAAPEELLAYVETKVLVGGTTTVQGSPPKNRPRDGWLVRNAEDETFGTGKADLVYAATLTAKAPLLADRANKMRAGSTFIYHCAEGQPGSVVASEFRAAADAGCLQDRFVAIHCNAITSAEFHRWKPAGAVVWSPFSNLWLYGTTTDVRAALAEGIHVCLGSDWAPSGTKHVLGELKVARIVADHLGWSLSDSDLVRMVTSSPGDVLAHSWKRQIGRLQPMALGDVIVVAAPARADPFSALIKARERDIKLVIVNGKPCYGTKELMSAAKASCVTPLKVDGEERALSLTQESDPSSPWPWEEIIARLEKVRANPKQEIDKARKGFAAYIGRLHTKKAPLRLALDMPTGIAPVGGLPKDLGLIEIPSLDSLTHDPPFLASLSGRGFHGGLLDRLADYYG